MGCFWRNVCGQQGKGQDQTNDNYDNAQADKKALLDASLQIDRIEGQCQVQAEGTLCGRKWFFKARGNMVRIDLEVCPNDKEWTCKTRKYDGDEHAAGWMGHEEAEEIIREIAAEWLKEFARRLFDSGKTKA